MAWLEKVKSDPKSPQNACLRVPKGFFTVMEVLVRALLKNKPLDVFEYGARFYENLLQVRTDTGHDPAVHGVRTEDRFKFKISAARTKADKGGRKGGRRGPKRRGPVTHSFSQPPEDRQDQGYRATLQAAHDFFTMPLQPAVGTGV